jgi:hypothetical protein
VVVTCRVVSQNDKFYDGLSFSFTVYVSPEVKLESCRLGSTEDQPTTTALSIENNSSTVVRQSVSAPIDVLTLSL